MTKETVIQLAQIVILGTLAQWTAWRLRLPSILVLLSVGIVAGPVTGWLHPDELIGEILLPVTSLSVAVILYEGGLSLRLRDLRSIGRTLFLLLSVGTALSWVTIATAAHWVLGFSWPIASLVGAILVVTGPTVIGPILRHLQLRGRAGTLLKWEGIVIDPLGASLAILVFVVIQATTPGEGIADAGLGLGLTLVVGAGTGYVAGVLVGLSLSRFWVPDMLHNPVSLMAMFAAFTLANSVQQDAGLLAVTVMGMTLANRKGVPIRHVVEFKETLSVLLIPALFVVLSARLSPEDLRTLDWRGLVFVGLLVVVARPLAVLVSTARSPLTWKERAFLSFMAPRGIVAAAIASLFAAQLQGQPGAEVIVPVVFLVVLATVLLYGLAAAPLARALGLAQSNPQGVLFVGAQSWARALAQALQQEGIPVFLVDTNWENARQARMAGLPCLYGNALAEEVRESIDMPGLGRMVAMTSNDEVNSLACQVYADDFGRKEVYQLPCARSKKGIDLAIPFEHRGRLLFQEDMAFARFAAWVGPHARVRKTKLTAAFDERSLRMHHGNAILPAFLKKADGSLQVWTATSEPDPRPGDMVISLVQHASS